MEGEKGRRMRPERTSRAGRLAVAFSDIVFLSFSFFFALTASLSLALASACGFPSLSLRTKFNASKQLRNSLSDEEVSFV